LSFIVNIFTLSCLAFATGQVCFLIPWTSQWHLREIWTSFCSAT